MGPIACQIPPAKISLLFSRTIHEKPAEQMKFLRIKVGMIGGGEVGTTTLSALLRSGSINSEIVIVIVIVIVNRNHEKAVGLAMAMQYAAALNSSTKISTGGRGTPDGASPEIVIAGVDGKDGGATDRNDSPGRRALIPANAEAYVQTIIGDEGFAGTEDSPAKNSKRPSPTTSTRR
jgi:hypothetical protein